MTAACTQPDDPATSPAWPGTLPATSLSDSSSVPAHLDRYRITARLDPDTHQVRGTESLTWFNRSSKPISTVLFHLYLNAFEHEKTVFAREHGTTIGPLGGTGKGHIDLLSLRDPSGNNLLEAADDQLIEGDRTQLRVSLSDPLPPGGSTTFEIEFKAQLPFLYARSGHSGSFHMVAQWFPKVAVLDPSGSWQSFPYHRRGEFFSDFANYDVHIVVPKQFVVGATGQRLSSTAGPDSTRRDHFQAHAVHDFAFAAWDRFEQRTASVDGVKVTVLAAPEYRHAAIRHLEVTADGLRHFGRLFSPYPYPQLTVVVPPAHARGAAGMEYPQLFVTDGPPIALPWLPAASELVTAHELAHQWFYGLVASNEVAYPMLDEGLTQWATGSLLRARHGSGSWFSLNPHQIDFFEWNRLRASRPSGQRKAPSLPAYEYEANEYASSVYSRTAVVMESVRRIWGNRPFEQAIRHYARTQRFRHPDPQDLFTSFDQAFGWPISKHVLAPALLDGEHSDVSLAGVEVRQNNGTWTTAATLENSGTLSLPVDVLVTDCSGNTHWRQWNGQGRRVTIRVNTPHPVRTVVVDPSQKHLLDPTPTNQRWDNPHYVPWSDLAPWASMLQLVLAGLLAP